MKTDRPGFALVFSLLLVLAMAVLAMGVLAVGTREREVAVAVQRRAQARQWAEAAALQAVRGWSTAAVLDMSPGEARLIPGMGPWSTAEVERIDSTLFLLRGRGAVPGPGGAAAAGVGLLVRVLDPRALAGALPGTVTAEVSARVDGGAIDGSGVCGGPAPGVVAPTAAVAPGAVVSGVPALHQAAAPPLPPALDPAGAVVLVATTVPGPTVTPRPLLAGGQCVPDAWNWGSPDPTHPCHDLLPIRVASDLTVDGGVGLGIVLVDGDLRVTGGAELTGVVVVRGTLRLDAGSTIRGAARAAAVISDGTLIHDGCAVARALATPPLDQAFRPPVRWWIPLF